MRQLTTRGKDYIPLINRECGHYLSVRSKPEGTVKNSFFENETIFVFITPRPRANLALKKNFIKSGHYKKIIPAQQPIRERVLL